MCLPDLISHCLPVEMRVLYSLLILFRNSNDTFLFSFVLVFFSRSIQFGVMQCCWVAVISFLVYKPIALLICLRLLTSSPENSICSGISSDTVDLSRVFFFRGVLTHNIANYRIALALDADIYRHVSMVVRLWFNGHSYYRVGLSPTTSSCPYITLKT